MTSFKTYLIALFFTIFFMILSGLLCVWLSYNFTEFMSYFGVLVGILLGSLSYFFGMLIAVWINE